MRKVPKIIWRMCVWVWVCVTESVGPCLLECVGVFIHRYFRFVVELSNGVTFLERTKTDASFIIIYSSL